MRLFDFNLGILLLVTWFLQCERKYRRKYPILPIVALIEIALLHAHFAIDEPMFGLSGLMMTSLVFGTTTKSISSIGIAPGKA